VILYTAILIASIPISLRLVGVKDYRCYGVALVSTPFINAMAVGAISPLLLIGVALTWRYRDRALIAAAAVAALVTLKLFLWPFVLWLAFTRRLRAALLSVGMMVIITLASWAILGFAGFRDYPRVLNILTHLLEGKGYSLVALGLSLGAPTSVSRALPWIVGAAALGATAIRGRRPGADSWTFIVAMGASFALSPIVWLHYFVLLYIPIGIARPRLSWLWTLPLAFWVCRGQSIDGVVWQKVHKHTDLALSPRIGNAPLIIYALALVTLILALSIRSVGRQAEP
jgi:alpha-1,2-mannosyltransferase